MRNRGKMSKALSVHLERMCRILGAKYPGQMTKREMRSLIMAHGYDPSKKGSMELCRSVENPLFQISTRDSNYKNPSHIIICAAEPGILIKEPPQLSEKSSDDLELKLKEFYESWIWKKTSYEIRKKYGQKCMCCGSSPKDHGVRIVCDHIKPIRKFWNLRLEKNNLQVLCDDCNRGKGSHDETDWR